MRKEIYFAGGCFWGVEKYFAAIKGVTETAVGYANGNTEHPSYEDVCHRNTGHAETVKVIYDSRLLTLDFLLSMFYEIIDPTSLNRQGNDVGVQYRTGVYYTAAEDKPVIEASLKELQKKYAAELAVEAAPLAQFYPAEEYHQHYLNKNPGGYCHIPAFKYDLASQAAPPAYPRKTREELKSELNELQFEVTQNSATEPPFRNEYYNHFQKGIYVDITTGEPLFVSSDKFESGCGWPSFSRPIDRNLIKELMDTSHHLTRTEVRSKTGDAHLGHVFTDGPAEQGGLRYCINSAALKFIPLEDMEQEGYGELIGLVK